MTEASLTFRLKPHLEKRNNGPCADMITHRKILYSVCSVSKNIFFVFHLRPRQLQSMI